MDRILIVDDEFLIRYTLEEGLKDRGYDAYSAATVEEGLEFVRKYHPGGAPSRQSPRKQCRDG
ncbi:MAG: hypothetical protein ACLTR6_08460 [Clostridium fessum]